MRRWIDGEEWFSTAMALAEEERYVEATDAIDKCLRENPKYGIM